MKKIDKTSLEQVENSQSRDYLMQEYSDLEDIPSRRSDRSRAKAGKEKNLVKRLLMKLARERSREQSRELDDTAILEEYSSNRTGRLETTDENQTHRGMYDSAEHGYAANLQDRDDSSNSNGWTGWTDLGQRRDVRYEPTEQEYAASWQLEPLNPLEHSQLEEKEAQEEEPQKRGVGKKVFSFLGFNVMLIVLFLILMAPIVLGYLWAFRDHSLWTLDYFHSLENHPLYFQRTMQFSALFAVVYSIAMTAFIFKIRKFRKQLFFVALIGSFLFSLYVWKDLLAGNIVNYWSF